MSKGAQDEKNIRDYLLHRLAEGEREKLEQRMMIDTDFYDSVLLIEDDLIEEYAEGNLSGKDKEDFEVAFLSGPDGVERVNLAKDLRKYASAKSNKKNRAIKARGDNPAWWRWLFFNPYVRSAGTAILVVAVALGVWRFGFYQSDLDKGIDILRNAYQDRRRVEARVTGFNYAPLRTTRGGEEDIDINSRNRAERILLDEAAENPSAASYGGLGQFYLAERKFDEATKWFEEALKSDPTDAKLHSDLGAALLEKGKESRSNDDSVKSTEEFNRSLHHLNEAIKLDDTFLEPLFNRALVLEEMQLIVPAREAWQRYLEKDPDSGWAEEARQKLKALEDKSSKDELDRQQFFQDFLSSYQTKNDDEAWRALKNGASVTGNLIVSRLADEFLELSAKHQPDEEMIRLNMLSYIGELELRKIADRFTADLAQFYSMTSRDQRTAIARARELLRSGQEMYFNLKAPEAAAFYNDARKLFEESGDSLESAVVDYWLHHCLSSEHREKLALAPLYRLEQFCKSKSYKWLGVRSLYALSGIHFSLNDQSTALNYGKQALSLAERIKDSDGALKVTIPMIECYRYLGNYNQCLDYIQLSLSFDSREPIQNWRHNLFVASSLYHFGLYDAAVEYQKEALRLALKNGNKAFISLSHANLGVMYREIAQIDEALNNVRLALQVAESYSDSALGQDNMAYSYLQMGHVYRKARDYDNAIASYEKSIDLYNNLAFSTHLYQAHKGKLFCHIEDGDASLTNESIKTAFGFLEKYRSKISEADDKNNFFDTEQSTYDLAIDFEYSKMNNPERAFEYSEASRSRSLLDLAGPNADALAEKYVLKASPETGFPPLTLSQIQESLPEGVQILQFTLLEKKLIIWLITKSSFKHVPVSVSQKDLTDKVLGYLRLISSPSEARREDLRREAMELFDVLIKPVELQLEENKQICIVPDKALYHLPFGTLISPASSRYLTEDYLITDAPSSSLFIVCSEIARQKEGFATERVLSVGNPRFDRNEFPELPDLPSARREAEKISAFYQSPVCLTGRDARKDRVKSEIEKANVIHLALHSIVDERSPQNSKLILAREPSGRGDGWEANGAMQAEEIYKLKLQQARVAILSACQTGAERYYGGEGMVSIARPFIAAGVPIVVASLWPVDTETTAELMELFHRYRKQQGLSTAESLRRAQLDMREHSVTLFRHPYYWAGFIVIGGQTKF
ncbi:MAG TPA: CHAT domain-containing protein [Blastocatellia bacterium]|nr:CHAT domain-containing protein [Blastocatellia bacterium]